MLSTKRSERISLRRSTASARLCSSCLFEALSRGMSILPSSSSVNVLLSPSPHKSAKSILLSSSPFSTWLSLTSASLSLVRIVRPSAFVAMPAAMAASTSLFVCLSRVSSCLMSFSLLAKDTTCQ